MSYDLKIRPLKTNKSLVAQTPAMKDGFIEKHPHSAIFNGCSGSGKTVLLGNMLENPVMYKGFYDVIYLFSGSPDDIFDQFDVDDKNRFDNPKTWEKELGKILEKHGKEVKKKGIHKASKVLVIFEDIQNHESWMRRSEYFRKCFIANRHYGVTCWLTSQSWTKTPRVCRINANCIYYFAGTPSERKLLVDEYCPDEVTPKEFRALIHHATSDEYNFLSIFNKKNWRKKFRKNLDDVLAL